MKYKFIVLVVLSILGCSNNGAEPEIFKKFEGSWGWESDESSVNCDRNPHKITFSKDLKKSYFDWEEPLVGSDGENHQRAIYSIKAFRENTITMQQDGESRKDRHGNLVVWDLIWVNESRYTWRRLDWSEENHTPFIVKCVDA